MLDPKDMAEKFRKNSVIIQGVPPGNRTEAYLKRRLKRISSVNALFLISLILGLQIFSSIFQFTSLSSKGMGLTSQIILVSVIIDTLQRIRSFLNQENNRFNHE